MQKRKLNNKELFFLILWVVIVIVVGLVEKEVFEKKRKFNNLGLKEPPKRQIEMKIYNGRKIDY